LVRRINRTQALEVIRANPELFKVDVLSTNNRTDLIIQQAVEFLPEVVVVAKPEKYLQVRDSLKGKRIRVLSGQEGLNEAVKLPGIDMVLSALVGYAGLEPTIGAIEAGKDIALANKETMVIAGELVTRLARRKISPFCRLIQNTRQFFSASWEKKKTKRKKLFLRLREGLSEPAC
jgi:1-deoxy-D-xylulose-5-phosphate reductoisomerase